MFNFYPEDAPELSFSEEKGYILRIKWYSKWRNFKLTSLTEGKAVKEANKMLKNLYRDERVRFSA